MIVVGVVDKTCSGIRRDYHQGYTRTIPEKAQRLNVSRVIVASALVKGDKDRCIFKKPGLSDNLVDNVGGKGLKQRERRGGRMTIVDLIRLDKGDCWQRVVLYILCEA